MENKKSIPIIVLAVFSISLLIMSDNLQSIYALEIFIKPTGDAPQSIYQAQSNNLTAILNTADDTVSVYDTTTKVLLRTISLANGYTGLGNPSMNHIACSGIICMTTTNGLTPNRAFAFNIASGAVGGINSGANFTSGAPLSGNYGFEINCDVQCTMWIVRNSATPPAGTLRVRTYGDGGDTINNAWSFISEFDTGLGPSDTISAVERGTITVSGNTLVILGYYYSTGFWYALNLGTNALVCTLTEPASSLTNPDTVIADNFFLFADGALGVRKITFPTTSSCIVSNTIATSQFESNAVLAIAYSTTNNAIYVNAGTSIYEVNATSFTTRIEYNTGASTEQGVDYDSSLDTLVQAVTSTDQVYFLGFQGTGASGSEQACIDTNLNGVIDGSDVCFNDTNGDGIPDVGQAGALGVLRTGANVTEFGFQINCAFGIGSCTDHNPKTNGVGLFYFLILLIISYAILVSIHVSAVRMLHKENVQVMEYLHIHPILLLVVLIVDLGITWQFQWLPDLIFYSTIVILVAGLTGFAFYSKLKSGGG